MAPYQPPLALDVAFIDIGMPHINGYELATTLRERFGAQLCLVAVTAYGSKIGHWAKGFFRTLTVPRRNV